MKTEVLGLVFKNNKVKVANAEVLHCALTVANYVGYDNVDVDELESVILKELQAKEKAVKGLNRQPHSTYAAVPAYYHLLSCLKLMGKPLPQVPEEMHKWMDGVVKNTSGFSPTTGVRIDRIVLLSEYYGIMSLYKDDLKVRGFSVFKDKAAELEESIESNLKSINQYNFGTITLSATKIKLVSALRKVRKLEPNDSDEYSALFEKIQVYLEMKLSSVTDVNKNPILVSALASLLVDLKKLSIVDEETDG